MDHRPIHVGNNLQNGDKQHSTEVNNTKAELRIVCEPQSAAVIRNSRLNGISPILPLNQLTTTVDSNNNYTQKQQKEPQFVQSQGSLSPSQRKRLLLNNKKEGLKSE